MTPNSPERPTNSTTFEICICGQAPAALLAELGDATQVTAPAETLLLTPLIDQDTLLRLVTRIRDLGLELRELRCLP